MPISDYRDLRVWQEAMDLIVEVYALSRRFPVKERYGLSAQLRRAAVSVASNIAEGNARRSRSEYLRFLDIAAGSLAEVRTQIEVATRLGMLESGLARPTVTRCERIARMLLVMRRSLRKALE